MFVDLRFLQEISPRADLCTGLQGSGDGQAYIGPQGSYKAKAHDGKHSMVTGPPGLLPTGTESFLVSVSGVLVDRHQ